MACKLLIYRLYPKVLQEPFKKDEKKAALRLLSLQC